MATITVSTGPLASSLWIGHRVRVNGRDFVITDASSTFLNIRKLFATINRKLRKRHARYRRGREAVRPRHRRSR